MNYLLTDLYSKVSKNTSVAKQYSPILEGFSLFFRYLIEGYNFKYEYDSKPLQQSNLLSGIRLILTSALIPSFEMLASCILFENGLYIKENNYEMIEFWARLSYNSFATLKWMCIASADVVQELLKDIMELYHMMLFWLHCFTHITIASYLDGLVEEIVLVLGFVLRIKLDLSKQARKHPKGPIRSSFGVFIAIAM